MRRAVRLAKGFSEQGMWRDAKYQRDGGGSGGHRQTCCSYCKSTTRTLRGGASQHSLGQPGPAPCAASAVQAVQHGYKAQVACNNAWALAYAEDGGRWVKVVGPAAVRAARCVADKVHRPAKERLDCQEARPVPAVLVQCGVHVLCGRNKHLVAAAAGVV